MLTGMKSSIVVAPTPDQAYAVQLNYIITPPSLHQLTILIIRISTRNAFRWCFNRSFCFLKGPMDMYNLYKSKYNEGVQNFALQQMGRRRRAEYDDGVPRVKIPSPSP